MLWYVMMPLLPPGAQFLHPGGPGCQRLSVTLLSFSITLQWYQSANRAPSCRKQIRIILCETTHSCPEKSDPD